ncbi:DUF4279 domain-containing protein [Pelomonas aquatica]|jgi:hypothetical protein|uniref:DUF4279 domain-containing protein n=1 Tax=Pelomonas aquatica TaxID=431058 RepID=A0A9X4RA75_9BURK|nr:DUF4279 domain-containing protein [Pelomonas aquatica]MCY4755790.1 DUF4279 domain-containing protein [Pelomonas aquatica]MDG0865183.1 DUF4279 domain-containing protein [Pelomonas aquatica]
MSVIDHSRACLRIFGDDLIPEEITAALGAAPTKSETRGEVLRSRNGRERVAKQGSWRLDAANMEPEDTNAQVQELLSKLTADLTVWHDMARRFEIDLFCGWFMGQTNDGAELSPATLLALGARGIALSLDIYAPTADE